jgi:biopolymer transport protein ExbD
MARRAGAPEVSAGSMADIAFLLLIFFLVTTTIETDAGLDRMLPPMEPPTEAPPIIKQKNIFTVNINRNGQLLVEDEILSIDK